MATLIAAPLVYSIQFASLLVWKANAHPLEKMLRKEFVGLGVADLAVHFRRHPRTDRRRNDVSRAFSALVYRLSDQASQGSRARCCNPPDALVPASRRTGALARNTRPGQSLQRLRSRDRAEAIAHPSRRGPGYHGHFALFAAVHAPQWPAPIPLFVLALIIGSVYHRTGSLIAAIFMHATFNGFSTLAMFVAILGGHEKEAKKVIDGVSDVPAVVVLVKRGVCGAMATR